MAAGFEKTNYAGVIFRVDSKTKERVYYVRYRLGGRGSKEICEPIGKSGAGMTAAKAARIRADRIRGKELSNKEQRQAAQIAKERGTGPMTLDRLWMLYQEAHAGKASLKGDQFRYRKHIAAALGNKLPDELTTADIDALHRAMSKKNYAAQTIKHALGQVRRILNFGRERGLCSPSPMLRFTMPRVDNLKTEAMTDGQLAAYLHALDEESDQHAAAFLRLMLFTGIRRSALLHLRWADCDMERKIITLQGQYAKKRVTDHVPMNRAAQEILAALPHESEYVFPGDDGGPRKDFRRAARRARDKAGLPHDFRPMHGLRHTFASALISSGKVSLYELQKLLTHENASMTQRYAHLADEAMQRAAAVADDIFHAASIKEGTE